MSEWPFTPEVETGGWQVQMADGDAFGNYTIDNFRQPLNDDSGDSDRDFMRADLEEQANINLIAAAPRMYRALKAALGDLVEHVEVCSTPDDCEYVSRYNAAREVIDWIDQR